MGTRPSQQAIKRTANRLASKYPGVEFRVLYASNGETAILPVDPSTGEPVACDPQRFVKPEPKSNLSGVEIVKL
jgi:hypothetical protein